MQHGSIGVFLKGEKGFLLYTIIVAVTADIIRVIGLANGAKIKCK